MSDIDLCQTVNNIFGSKSKKDRKYQDVLKKDRFIFDSDVRIYDAKYALEVFLGITAMQGPSAPPDRSSVPGS